MLKRLIDILFVIISIPASLPLALVTGILVRVSSKGPILFWSKRVGLNNQLFNMPKFRSMRSGAPQLASHLMNQKANMQNDFLTPVGSFIRKSSLDELPQLWSVLIGDMSLVGPRPALFNQYDLIALRTEHEIQFLKPGITGWAQVNGRDELPIPEKVELDFYYLKHQCLLLDLHIILLTFLKVIKRDNVSH